MILPYFAVLTHHGQRVAVRAVDDGEYFAVNGSEVDNTSTIMEHAYVTPEKKTTTMTTVALP